MINCEVMGICNYGTLKFNLMPEQQDIIEECIFEIIEEDFMEQIEKALEDEKQRRDKESKIDIEI
ncbi:MAG: hypothetical protein IJW32_00045 [Clostridia bacterium]|nr:hypothetical protein [Clostridia bacterium]MBQ9792124.1 hypothetical protein [Clostridia bacterium]